MQITPAEVLGRVDVRVARLGSPAEATERLVGSPVFKTGGGLRDPRRVRFPSASAEIWRTGMAAHDLNPPYS